MAAERAAAAAAAAYLRRVVVRLGVRDRVVQARVGVHGHRRGGHRRLLRPKHGIRLLCNLRSTDLAFRGSESMPGDRECGVFSLKHKQPLGSSVWTARRALRPASLRRASSLRLNPRPAWER